ncbi:hypothetical protein [Yersinia enterocolitica]|uniref:hypothetical protein n=1 Tax=Yersinia enterocolitica TaxID=630 RepID=UPI00065A8393|nr:hypothetical protein [Yersinia enterocolitica]CRY18529.1 Serine rich protein [Yersinia enterocolitica]
MLTSTASSTITTPRTINSASPNSKFSSGNEGTLASSLTGVTSAHAKPCPISSNEGVDSQRTISFSSNSADGTTPLADVNTKKHIAILFKALGKDANNTDELKKFEHIMRHDVSHDIKNLTLKRGNISTLALFSLLPEESRDSDLMAKANKYCKAMEDSLNHPQKEREAVKAINELSTAIMAKFNFSDSLTGKANLAQFCNSYLKEFVYPDIIAKLDGKLSADYLQTLRENPKNVESHLYEAKHTKANKMITTLQQEFFGFKDIGGQSIKMFSLIEELGSYTGLMADLKQAPDAAVSYNRSPLNSAPFIPEPDYDLEPTPVNSNNAAQPGSVINNITNITTNNNYYYSSPPTPPVVNHTITFNVAQSGSDVTTQPEDNKSQSTTTTQTAVDTTDSSNQVPDEIDDRELKKPLIVSSTTLEPPVVKQDEPANYITTLDIQVNADETPPPADNSAREVSTKAVAKHTRFNAQGSLLGASGPIQSYTTAAPKVTLTRGGQVRDLSQKQNDERGGSQQKSPSSVNTQGTSFAGLGENTVELQQAKPNNAQMTLAQQDARAHDLSKQLTYRLGGSQQKDTAVQQKSLSSLIAQGNPFARVGNNASVPTQSWLDSYNRNPIVTLTERGALTRDLSQKEDYRKSDTNVVNTGRSQLNKQPTEIE